jgi:hypothetical protein
MRMVTLVTPDAARIMAPFGAGSAGVDGIHYQPVEPRTVRLTLRAGF